MAKNHVANGIVTMKQSADEFQNAALRAFEAGSNVTPRDGFYAGFDAGYEAGAQSEVWYREGYQDGRREVWYREGYQEGYRAAAVAAKQAAFRLQKALKGGQIRDALFEVEQALAYLRIVDPDPESK